MPGLWQSRAIAAPSATCRRKYASRRFERLHNQPRAYLGGVLAELGQLVDQDFANFLVAELGLSVEGGNVDGAGQVEFAAGV